MAVWRGGFAWLHHRIAHQPVATHSRPDPDVLAAAHNNLALVRADSGDPASAFLLIQGPMAQVVRMGDRHCAAALGSKVFYAPAWHAYT